jgi:hypothetical protein
MSVRCPRCGNQVEELVALDGLQFNYKGPLTRACENCRDAMIGEGVLVPSGTAERIVRARRVAQRVQKETGVVRQRRWVGRLLVALVVLAAAFWAWRRFFQP